MTKDELAGILHAVFSVADPNGYVGDFDLKRPVTIDGRYKLRDVADTLLKTMALEKQPESELDG